MRQALNEAIQHWVYIAPVVKYPKDDRDLDILVSELDDLLQIVGNDENHRLIGFVDVISGLIESYEAERFKNQQPNLSGIDLLKFLMEEHNLKQADLNEIGSQGVISEILKGKRQLNVRQIKILAEKFHVSPVIFLD